MRSSRPGKMDVNIHPAGKHDQAAGIQYLSTIRWQILTHRTYFVILDQDIPLQGSAPACDQSILDQYLIHGIPFP